MKLRTVENDERYRVDPGTVLKVDQFNNAYLVIPFMKYPRHLWNIVKPGSMWAGMRAKAIVHFSRRRRERKWEKMRGKRVRNLRNLKSVAMTHYTPSEAPV